MRRSSHPRGHRSVARVAALAASLAAPGIAPVARGQEPPARPAEGANPPAEAPAPAPPPAPAPNPYGVPGPEVFVKAPETPLELWDAVDYLVRTGQVKQAVPYLDAFLKQNPDDATLLQVRDRYGPGSILRLQDYPETRARARTLVDMLAAASRRSATQPERLSRYIDALTKSPEEQQYGVERLREAGPYAVPALVEAMQRDGLDPEARLLIARNMGRLDRAAVPPLIATLDSPDPHLAADAARALGSIGDPRAVPHLSYLAAQNGANTTIGGAARRAIAAITGKTFESQPRSPVRLLVDEARGYHTHAVRFPGDEVVVWSWDDARKVPAPRQVSRGEAEGIFGLRLASEALRIDPADVPAQVVLVSLALEKAIDRAGGVAGFTTTGGDAAETFAAAVSAGPAVLSRVLRSAIDDRKWDLAAVAATALGLVTDRDALATDRRPNPLVEALWAPGRRTQFAAARALVELDPRRPFAGSSRVVPVLARFVANQQAPRAVVIDGNVARGNRLVGFLREMGYDPTLAATGDEGFRAASETADVELIVVDPHMVQGAWRLLDALANLRADARTSAIPTYVVGPLGFAPQLDSTLANFPGVKLLVTPPDAANLERQLGGKPSELSDAERAGYARDAAALLARLALRPGSPFEADLDRVEPSLAIALNTPATSLAASAAMGDVPDAAAQRGLAAVVLDTSRPTPLRLGAAVQLSRSIQRFGPLVEAGQETQLLEALDAETDPTLRTALAAIVGAMRPKPGTTGGRLQRLGLPASPAEPTPESASPTPGAASSPPPPEAAPPANAEAPAAPPADANPR
jgi:CheY-like chemotaxis protein